MVAFPFKVKYGIHHMLQHTRTSQSSFLGHMPYDKDRNVIGLGQLHEFSCHLAYLGNRPLHSRNLRRHNSLYRVDNEKIWLNSLYFCPHALHIGLSIEIKLTINIPQALCTEFDLLSRLLPTDIENCSYLRQLG